MRGRFVRVYCRCCCGFMGGFAYTLASLKKEAIIIVRRGRVGRVPILRLTERRMGKRHLPFVVFIRNFADTGRRGLRCTCLLTRGKFEIILPSALLRKRESRNLSNDSLGFEL